MYIAVIGGMDRLERHYRQEAGKFGVEHKVFNTPETGVAFRIRTVEAIVIFTNKVLHRARKEVLSTVRNRTVYPFRLMRRMHAERLFTLLKAKRRSAEWGRGCIGLL